ncbi:MAG: cobalamin-dependent protein [Nitrospirae bacterium]|nr:cobalamin-dependent protein [Nitrospirota bacterium]
MKELIQIESAAEQLSWIKGDIKEIRRAREANPEKILFIHPPTTSKHPEPPLGIAYLGAFLEQYGFRVTLLDMDPLGLTDGDLRRVIREGQFRFVGVSWMTPQNRFAENILAIIKSIDPDIVTIAGGPHPSALPDEVASNPNCDFVVYGEGELTCLELMMRYDELYPNFNFVDGLVWKVGGRTRVNGTRALLQDMDTLPYPLWRELSRVTYLDMPVYHQKEIPVFPVITGRGCPYECVFCDEDSIWKRRVRFRSIPNVIGEIKMLQEMYGAHTFNILDDTFTLKKSRIKEFCEAIRQHCPGIEWRCTGKVNTIFPDMLAEMKSAGCRLIAYGVESGDQKVLDAIKKKQTLARAKEAFAMTREAGISSFALCMVGNLEENWESIEKTIKFLDELKPDFASCSISTPYPGSQLYPIAEKNGWICDSYRDWEKWVPTPHSVPNYKPVCTNGILSQDELLKAYYYVNRHIAFSRLRARYGKCYYFNPLFVKREIIFRLITAGPKAFFQMFFRLIFTAKIKREPTIGGVILQDEEGKVHASSCL